MRRLPPYRFSGGTAVLTGAASGIGEQLAHGLAERGSNVVLLDRDAERLQGVVDRIRRDRPAASASALVVDLADRDATMAAADVILREHPRVTLLVNNAGVALGGRFDQITLEEFDRVMAINLHAPVVLTHRLLPALTARPGGHIVNVSSLYGIVSPPGQSAYSASKFGLRGFSQVLRAELAASGTGVTTVHPGGIRTRIADSARIGSGVPRHEVDGRREDFRKLLSYPPEKAAAEILDGVHRRKARVLIALSAKIPDMLARLFPVGHGPLLDKAVALRTKQPVRRPR